ncbi:MAG: hypothetical protein ACM3PW_13590, partial [Chlamydiota bacterium]
MLIGVISNHDSALDDKVLHGYIDDSKHPVARMICAGGYLFEPAMARKFRDTWQAFAATKRPDDDGEGEFCFHANDAIRRDDAEEIFSKLVMVIKATALRGFVEFVKPETMRTLHEKIKGYVGSAYSMTTLGCMKLMADVAREQHKTVLYFIEDGNEFAGELRCFLNQIKDNA